MFSDVHVSRSSVAHRGTGRPTRAVGGRAVKCIEECVGEKGASGFNRLLSSVGWLFEIAFVGRRTRWRGQCWILKRVCAVDIDMMARLVVFVYNIY